MTHLVGQKRRVWEGLVSDPVRIKWKKSMDPTKGLLDAACDLTDAEKVVCEKNAKRSLSVEDRVNLPEYEKLVGKVQELETGVENTGEGDDDGGERNPMNTSFFAWFGYRGKVITAEESAVADQEDTERWERISKGEKDDEDDEASDDDDDDDDDDEDGMVDVEIFPDGEELAIFLGEDVWPNALKYYGEDTPLPLLLFWSLYNSQLTITSAIVRCNGRFPFGRRLRYGGFER